ncbi:hypothetical protein [Pyrobaculum neutrophilum]|uniref:PIN domain-containing protein n=1 Tax=Pyrobaculum neutrophilum (strain DSM 2338 / JCM 9278 / NBRC 100436 / V24Sta) TaxID=444157 RepID=B1YDV8_PYRNV|nr:hypothetical protein [Pyrobaculum neutrophilum]ACB39971.1 conserved hypothetical protein [Pyrobaculum neutrophilum V24Sta]
MEARGRKGRFRLEPDAPQRYRRIYVDLFSIAAALSSPEEVFRSAAESGLDAVFVLDAWSETHLPLARRYMELCRRYNLDCRLAERGPAELYAVELCEAECGRGCAVVTRDYDAAKAAATCAVLIQRGGRFYRATYI